MNRRFYMYLFASPAGPAHGPKPPPGLVRIAPLFVWGVWALMLLAGLAFVWQYGRNVPFWDEWNMVPILTGERPVDAAWLWSEHNGHRIPLPRLLLVGLYKLTGSDFRAGMYFNVAALGALALAMIRVAKGVRGEVAWTDAIFPLALLHWGHYENLLWSWQVTQVMPVLLAGVLLLIIVRSGARLTPAGVVLAGMCLAALPLCGVPGLVYVPPLALWLGYVGLLDWRSGERQARQRSLAAWGLTAAAILLSALYFVGYHEPARHWTVLRLRGCAATTLAFLAGGFGPAAARFRLLWGLGVFALLLASAGALLVAVWGGRPPGRPRALGLLCFLAAVACLALSVGLGRTGYGFTPRYFLFAAPALCCVYFTWGVYSRPALGRFAQTCLFALIVFTCAFNFQAGHASARAHRDRLKAFEDDLLAGESEDKLLARHAGTLCPCPWGEGVSFHDWLGGHLRALCHARVGPFRSLRLELPDYREVPLPVPPSCSGQGAGDGRVGPRAGERPYLLLELPGPRFVCGIRLTCRDAPYRDGIWYFTHLYWNNSGRDEFTPARRYIHCWRPERRTVTVWVHDTVEQLRIDTDGEPGAPGLSEVVLLVPSGGEPAVPGP
jgi:hypothetical protein